ncbi:PRA1 family protein E-like [Coffea eugenioides]|uniref:PRA1 family protein n=1 Tax=Coffea arabica TaxID=13443 RepID=A0ABM4X7Z5_COFAR|nr:PRA1 family protein E-like [Coffea eugenioides]
MSSPAQPTAATQLRQRLRPWAQFFSLSTFSLPISLSDTTYRINQNLRFFFPNYTLLVLLVLFLSLIYHPLSLIIFLVIFAGWLFLYFSRNPDDPLIILNFEISDKIVLGLLGLVTLVALIFAKVWLNVVVSVVIGVVIVCLHGALRAPEEDLESPYGSLLSDVTSPSGDYTMV